jgi:putative transposase
MNRPGGASETTVPSTHLCLTFHVVFSTKERRPLIVERWRPRLHAYLGGTVRSLRGTPLAVGGTADHVHLLMGLRATHCLAAVVRDVKHASSEWVHTDIGMNPFAWQEGYGAFTVSPERKDGISRYIAQQEEHHRLRSFQEEYLGLLREHEVEYDERYLW